MLRSTVHEYLKAKEMTLRKARETVFSEGECGENRHIF
jgi:hypothetical protein